jgi:hypothetical protein
MQYYVEKFPNIFFRGGQIIRLRVKKLGGVNVTAPKMQVKCGVNRVFDTCINSRISRSLENRAFFIKKMSNLPLLILRNIG